MSGIELADALLALWALLALATAAGMLAGWVARR